MCMAFAATALAPSVRPLAVAIVPAALLLLAISLACAFHTSLHADWMMDNTIPRLLWYVSAIPLFALVRE